MPRSDNYYLQSHGHRTATTLRCELHTVNGISILNSILNPSGGILAFAGLWERWRDPEGDLIESCTIITTAANEFMSAYHNRMPAIIPPSAFDAWLDPENRDTAKLVPIRELPFPGIEA